MSHAENSSTPQDAPTPIRKKPPSHRKPASLLAGVFLLVAGIAALAMPWVGNSPKWDWSIRTFDDLAGAEVIANVVHLGDGDFFLQAQRDREISLISPPLEGIASGHPLVEVTISRINGVQFAHVPPVSVPVNLFWQTAHGQPFRMEETSILVQGDGSPASAILAPAVDAGAIHRIGVQVVDVSEIRIRSIRMLDADMGRRAEFLNRELSEPELFGGESVNFYKGPNLLGRSLNYYLLAMCGVTLGVFLMRSWHVRRRPSCFAGAVAVLIPWILGDVFFSTQLARRAIAEAGALRRLAPGDALRAVYGDGLATAAGRLQVLPVGSRVGVFAQDRVTSGHRLAYLAAPHMVFVDRPLEADYIVLLDGEAIIRKEQTLFMLDTGEQFPIRVIATWPRGALVERVSD